VLLAQQAILTGYKGPLPSRCISSAVALFDGMSGMYSKEKIYSFLQETLVSLFEIEPKNITPEANLYEDLDIDSIDAVDLTVKLKEFTGRRIQPTDFKQVRTVQDVVDAVYELLNKPQTSDADVEQG
jgi:acyl carrier protein